MTSLRKNVGAMIACLYAAAPTAIVAGSGTDNAEITGVIIDRLAHGTPLSGVMVIPFTTTLAAAATLSLAYTVQEGQLANLSDAATLVSAAPAVVATGPGGGGTVTGQLQVDLNLAPAGRYVRVRLTPNLSAANTDTAALAAVMVLGGTDRVPA